VAVSATGVAGGTATTSINGSADNADERMPLLHPPADPGTIAAPAEGVQPFPYADRGASAATAGGRGSASGTATTPADTSRASRRSFVVGDALATPPDAIAAAAAAAAGAGSRHRGNEDVSAFGPHSAPAYTRAARRAQSAGGLVSDPFLAAAPGAVAAPRSQPGDRRSGQARPGEEADDSGDDDDEDGEGEVEDESGNEVERQNIDVLRENGLLEERVRPEMLSCWARQEKATGERMGRCTHACVYGMMQRGRR